MGNMALRYICFCLSVNSGPEKYKYQLVHIFGPEKYKELLEYDFGPETDNYVSICSFWS